MGRSAGTDAPHPSLPSLAFPFRSSIPPEQALGKITLFQELTLHSNNPAYPAPPLDPTHLSALQTSLNRATAASGTVPFKGRLFPMPGMQNREDGSGGGTVEGVEGGGGMRDSQGRLFPGQVAGRRTGEDENGNMGGDAELLERRMEKERESETGLSDRGALLCLFLSSVLMLPASAHQSYICPSEASSTSWALLRSRSNQPPSAETLSTLSSSPSSDFSTNSVPSPSIPLSSSPSSSSPPSSRQQPMTDRQREQAEFDRLLERERSATDAYGGGPQATGSAGDKWAELRGRNLGGGRMGGGAEADYRAPKAPAGEVVW